MRDKVDTKVQIKLYNINITATLLEQLTHNREERDFTTHPRPVVARFVRERPVAADAPAVVGGPAHSACQSFHTLPNRQPQSPGIEHDPESVQPIKNKFIAVTSTLKNIPPLAKRVLGTQAPRHRQFWAFPRPPLSFVLRDRGRSTSPA